MTDWKKNITIEVLGLERQLWESVDISEQKAYINAILHYVGFVICAFMGSYALLYLISSSFLLTLITGSMLGLILSSIVRFSLIILRKSIFDVSKSYKKNQVIPLLNGTILNAKNNSQPHSSRVRKVVIGFINKINFIKFPKWRFAKITGDSKIPGLAMMIRLIILSTIGLLLTFPIACLFHFSEVENLNTIKREQIKQRFVLDARKNLDKKTSLFRTNIEEIKNQISKNIGIYQVNGLMKQKQKELEKLNKDLDGFTIENEEDYQKQLKIFSDQIGDKYFVISIFYAAVNFPLFFPVFFAVFYLLFYSHIKLILIKNSKIYIYPKESTRLYKEAIEKEYHETQAYLKQFLLKNYQYDASPFMENSFYLNPPYCTEKRTFFKKRLPITKQAFLDHFNVPKKIGNIEN